MTQDYKTPYISLGASAHLMIQIPHERPDYIVQTQDDVNQHVAHYIYNVIRVCKSTHMYFLYPFFRTIIPQIKYINLLMGHVIRY